MVCGRSLGGRRPCSRPRCCSARGSTPQSTPGTGWSTAILRCCRKVSTLASHVTETGDQPQLHAAAGKCPRSLHMSLTPGDQPQRHTAAQLGAGGASLPPQPFRDAAAGGGGAGTMSRSFKRLTKELGFFSTLSWVDLVDVQLSDTFAQQPARLPIHCRTPETMKQEHELQLLRFSFCTLIFTLFVGSGLCPHFSMEQSLEHELSEPDNLSDRAGLRCSGTSCFGRRALRRSRRGAV